jgi:hypothetical protein
MSWDFNPTNLLDAVLWMLLVFVWIAFIFVWIRCVFDLFADRSLGGLAKSLWALLFIFFPPLTTLGYLLIRGRSMGERQLQALSEAQAAQAAYIQQVAGGSATPADQIKQAKELLDAGAISQPEFDQLKAKALA